MNKTDIEWCDLTWNPLRGCTIADASCLHCYAMGVAARFSGPGLAYEGLATRTEHGPMWTNKIALVPKVLPVPLRVRKPQRIFVNSMSDLFHRDVPDEYIDRVFAVMELAHWHTFQILTKRAERMFHYVVGWLKRRVEQITRWAKELPVKESVVVEVIARPVPMQNLRLGISAGLQEKADERIPWLLKTPAVCRFVSAEPLIERMVLRDEWLALRYSQTRIGDQDLAQVEPRIDQLIVGGESGKVKDIRPMKLQWARDLRDQCVEHDVAFFMKQWGEFTPYYEAVESGQIVLREYATGMKRVGKAKAGRILDGRTWEQEPVANLSSFRPNYA